MSESSTRHADDSWPHPGSETARTDGRYAPSRHTVPSEHPSDDAAGPRD